MIDFFIFFIYLSNFAFLPRQLPNPLITGSCEARLPSKTHCYEIQDRKTCLTAIDTRKDFKSPCGWCFGKNCRGSQNLCEPMKWLQQNKLKLLQDYEDCLEPGESIPPNPFVLKQFFAFTTSKSLNYRLM